MIRVASLLFLNGLVEKLEARDKKRTCLVKRHRPSQSIREIPSLGLGGVTIEESHARPNAVPESQNRAADRSASQGGCNCLNRDINEERANTHSQATNMHSVID
ncbi:hypothetical protein BX600DRAFT_450385 [Xylariales sp. PMI_506]|nr:hypothetical protein BX600DRAFT_450385 [Xylariales sp. PMI_506]